jgi:hypothetical protein
VILSALGTTASSNIIEGDAPFMLCQSQRLHPV